MNLYDYAFEDIEVIYPTNGLKAVASGIAIVQYHWEGRATDFGRGQKGTPVFDAFVDLTVDVEFETDGTYVSIDPDDKATIAALAAQIYPQLDQDHILDEIYDEESF